MFWANLSRLLAQGSTHRYPKYWCVSLCYCPVVEAVLVLCHSLMLLSNDKTNPSIRNKMSKREYIKNTTKALEGLDSSNIDTDYLGHMYDNVYLCGHVAPARLLNLWAALQTEYWLLSGQNTSISLLLIHAQVCRCPLWLNWLETTPCFIVQPNMGTPALSSKDSLSARSCLWCEIVCTRTSLYRINQYRSVYYV